MDLSLNIDGEYCLEKGLKLIHFYLLVPCEQWFYTYESSFENNGIPGLKCYILISAGLLIFENEEFLLQIVIFGPYKNSERNCIRKF